MILICSIQMMKNLLQTRIRPMFMRLKQFYLSSFLVKVFHHATFMIVGLYYNVMIKVHLKIPHNLKRIVNLDFLAP